MTKVMLHGMHLASDFFEAVVDVLELHAGFAKLFILAPLESFTTIVEFSSDLPMVPSCHVLCVVIRRWWWLGRLAMPVHDAKPQGLYMERKWRRVSLLPHLGDYIKPIATQMSEQRAK